MLGLQGDPYDTSVILRTRAVPLPSSPGQSPDQRVSASYKVSNKSDPQVIPSILGGFYQIRCRLDSQGRDCQVEARYNTTSNLRTNPSVVDPSGSTKTITGKQSKPFLSIKDVTTAYPYLASADEADS